MKFIWSLLATLAVGCAQVTGLNLKKHKFGMQPTKVIWFQVAGLDTEHLAMLRFSSPTVETKPELEQALCLGRAWSFNLYHLRPAPGPSFLSQLSGKKDIQNSCEDWKQKAMWEYVVPRGFAAAIIEMDGRGDESLISAMNCGPDGARYLKDTTLWLMQSSAPAQAKPYLPAVEQTYKTGEIYWDQSCNSRGCGSSLSSVLSSLYPTFARKNDKHLFIVRDFSYAHALARKDLIAARDILRELDKSAGTFMRAAEEKDDMLVIVSGAAAIDLDFPSEGKDWQQFEQKGTNAFPRLPQLSSPVFATGARAENFCGLYEESELFERTLSSPRAQGLELKFINPFN